MPIRLDDYTQAFVKKELAERTHKRLCEIQMGKTKEGKLIRIEIADSWGFNEEVAPELYTLVNSFNPGYARLFSPSPFIVYFEEKTKEELDAILNDIFQFLKSKKKILENTVVFCKDEQAAYKISDNGEILSMPFGSPSFYNKENVVYFSKNEE